MVMPRNGRHPFYPVTPEAKTDEIPRLRPPTNEIPIWRGQPPVPETDEPRISTVTAETRWLQAVMVISVINLILAFYIIIWR